MTVIAETPKQVTVFGGSGFVGRYVTQRMARAGWRVRRWSSIPPVCP